MTAILLFALWGCAHPAPPAAAVAVDRAAPRAVPAPNPPRPLDREESAAVQRLLPRDPEPTCAEVEAGLSQPGPSLVKIAEQVVSPPWAGMRAATCAIERSADPLIEAALMRWVLDPELAGLGLLAVNLLDRMPEEVAIRVAGTALEGPLSDRARDEIAGSAHQTVRALLLP